MLLHTHLPNLHHHSPPQSPPKFLPNKPPPMLPLFQSSKDLRTLSTQHTHSRQSITKAEKNLSSLSNAQISIKVRQNKHHTQNSLSQDSSTLQMKLLQNPQVFHSKAKNFRDKQKQKKRNVAPYFFKIHNSLKILQAQDQLNRKKHLARLQQQKLKTIQLQQSKKKLSKKLLPHSSQTTIQSSPNTILPQPNNSSALQTKRAQVTKKAIDGEYSFNLFNSGQIFEQIALINQKRHLATQPDYRVTAYGRLDRFGGKNVEKKKENLFKQEYNMFLKAKLPPSFGQNTKNPDIYEEFVEKTRLSNLQNVKSKLVEGKYLPSQPQKPFSSQFIFGNEIRVISSKKIELQNMYDQAKQAEEKARLQQKSIKIIKNASTVQTSKAVTEFNSKRNTLRDNQSLKSKVKLKKLAKQAQKERMSQSVKTEPGFNSNIAMKTQPGINSGKKGRGRAYSIINNVTEQQMQKFITKAGNILGQYFLQQSNFPSQSAINLSPKKVTSKSIELNEFESKHLQHIDRLLRKQESILKKEKEDLDSYPWRCSIQVKRKRPF